MLSTGIWVTCVAHLSLLSDAAQLTGAFQLLLCSVIQGRAFVTGLATYSHTRKLNTTIFPCRNAVLLVVQTRLPPWAWQQLLVLALSAAIFHQACQAANCCRWALYQGSRKWSSSSSHSNSSNMGLFLERQVHHAIHLVSVLPPERLEGKLWGCVDSIQGAADAGDDAKHHHSAALRLRAILQGWPTLYLTAIGSSRL
jgi:hypothetical protein